MAVNGSFPPFPLVPFGGFKESGLGRELGPEGLLNFLEPRSIGVAPVAPRSLRGRVMGGPLSGVRAVEVASHVFVPMAGTVLSEWGADVVKIEHPVTGDPYRGLVTSGLHNEYRGVDPFFQSANRGKRSVGIDLGRPEGRELLGRLVREADVFLTSLRPAARRRLRVEVEDVRADNPAVVYVRGSAFGARGPDAGRGGYDVSAYWARSGMQYVLTPPGAPGRLGTRPAFGDVVGGLTIAGAVSAALFSRASTGHAAVVDASLLASGMWQVQPDIVNAVLGGGGATDAPPERARTSNPLSLPYRTADGRHVALIMVESDRRWPELCAALGHPEMADDPAGPTPRRGAATPARAWPGSTRSSRRGRSRSGAVRWRTSTASGRRSRRRPRSTTTLR